MKKKYILGNETGELLVVYLSATNRLIWSGDYNMAAILRPSQTQTATCIWFREWAAIHQHW